LWQFPHPHTRMHFYHPPSTAEFPSRLRHLLPHPLPQPSCGVGDPLRDEAAEQGGGVERLEATPTT
jgi:hypothetical protein